MNRSLKNKLSLAAAIGSLICQYRGQRKLALGLSILAAGLHFEPTLEQKEKMNDLLAQVIPESEPSTNEGESLTSAEINSAISSSRLVH